MEDSESQAIVLWGTLKGWSEKLGVPQDVLKEKLKGLTTKPCRTKVGDEEVVADAYREDDVMRVCAEWVKELNGSETESMIVRLFGQHTVSFHCIDKDASTDVRSATSPRSICVSGFILSVREHWFFVTAGHVLQHLDTNLDSGQRVIVNAQLLDTFGVNPISSVPIPIDYPNSQRFYINDDGLGLDCGFIYLEHNIRKLLEANGIKSLDENVWLKQSDTYEYYALLGFPSELTESQFGNSETGTGHQLRLNLVMTPIRKLDGQPENTEKVELPRFYAKLHDKLPLEDIDGMSGGPIFGFQHDADGRLRYWLVAVQSGWYPNKRILFACPVALFTEVLLRKLYDEGHISFDDESETKE